MSTSSASPEPDFFAAAAHDAAPGLLVLQAKRLLDQAQNLVEQAVIAERMKGTSWETIGVVLDGVTKSAAQKRFGQRVTEWSTVAVQGRHIDETQRNPQFSLAWKQLATHWRNADSVIHVQEHIAALSNATAAASGTDFNNGECEGIDTASLAAALSTLVSLPAFPEGTRREVLTVTELDNLGTHRGRRVADPCLVCAARSPEEAQSPAEDSQDSSSGRLDQLEKRVRELEESAQRAKALEAARGSQTKWPSEDQRRAVAGASASHEDAVVYQRHGSIRPGETGENRQHPGQVIVGQSGSVVVTGLADTPRDTHPESDRR